MLQMKPTLWRLMTVALLSLGAHSQSTYYSMLCSLTRESNNPAVSLAGIHLEIGVHARKASGIKISLSEGPRRIMILQDISGSMSYLNAQKLSIAAVKDFAESAPATDQLGLVDFNTDAFI